MIVTDIKYRLKSGLIQQGYYMDGYLAENLAPIPRFLAKDRDCVGIISGRGMTRNGKSTFGIQIGYYISWLLAGGEMDIRRNDDGKHINPVVIKYPSKKVNFSLNNLVYSPDELISKARELPKSSVIIYDEGRSGLDSKGTMSALNKMLEDFFQECGVFNHVILIILPNFFKLNEDIATSRSMFLIDTYCDDDWNRGFFNFYNLHQKEWLYFLGKKKIGVTNKYLSVTPSFYGRFRDWIPFDKRKYEEKKKEALKKKTLGSREERTKEKYIGLLKIYKDDTGKTTEETANRLSEVLSKVITTKTLEHGIEDYQRYAKMSALAGGVA